MEAQFSDTHFSPAVTPQMSQSERHHHHDWSFLPTFGGGMSGIVIGYVIGMMLGWC